MNNGSGFNNVRTWCLAVVLAALTVAAGCGSGDEILGSTPPSNPAAPFGGPAGAAAPLAINLRSAITFGIASRAAMSSTGVTVVNGDIALQGACSDATGTPPAPGAGVPPPGCQATPYAHPTGMTVNGTIYWPTDSNAGVTALAATNDLNLAWVEGNALIVAPNHAADFLGNQLGLPGPVGKVITPGTYNEGVLNLAAGTVATLDGSATDVWIFKVGSSMTDSGILVNKSEIKLAGGAQARNVWFVVMTSATIGSGTIWNGNILAGNTITINNSSTLNGRALGGAAGAGAVSLTGATTPFVGGTSVTTINVP